MWVGGWGGGGLQAFINHSIAFPMKTSFNYVIVCGLFGGRGFVPVFIYALPLDTHLSRLIVIQKKVSVGSRLLQAITILIYHIEKSRRGRDRMVI
jgi:hypothetical protein